MNTKKFRSRTESGKVIVKFFWWPLIVSIVISVILTVGLNLML